MANLREAYSATALANLGWSEYSERPVDRVAAAGRCNELGVDLWKAKYQNDAGAFRRCLKAFLTLYRSRYPRISPRFGEALVSQVLREFLHPFCVNCLGAKSVMVGKLKVICPVCEGVGVRRFSDEERARSMGESYALVKRYQYHFGWIHGKISGLERGVNDVMGFELER